MNLKTDRNSLGRQSADKVDEFLFAAATAIGAFKATNIVIPQDFNGEQVGKVFANLPVITNEGGNTINFENTEGFISETIPDNTAQSMTDKGYSTIPEL